jgi:PKD repeat protein
MRPTRAPEGPLGLVRWGLSEVDGSIGIEGQMLRRSSVLVAGVLLPLLLLAGGMMAAPGAHASSPRMSPPPAPCDPPASPSHPADTPIVEAAVARNPSDAGIDLDFCSTIAGVTGPYYLNWTFGDGTKSTIRDPVHVYAEPANYTVVLQLNSSDYNTTSTIYALVNSPVQATTVYTPLAPTTATPVNFTSKATQGTPPYTVFWTFGDGMTATGLYVLHTFFTAGNYTIQCWTNDTGGGSTYELFQIVVTAAPPPPHQPTGSTDILIGVGVAAVAVAVAGFAYLQWDKKRRPKLPTTSPPPTPPSSQPPTPPPGAPPNP